MATERKVLIFENSYSLANYLLKKWQELAQEAVSDHNQFNVALSGGRTPTEFYCRLSALGSYGLWQKTHLFCGDERFVASDHKDNNFRMIKANLINYIHIPPENVHPIRTDVENAAVAAELFKDELVGHFAYQRKTLPASRQVLPTFDLILLGIGEDGHTASLFPGMAHTADASIVTLPVSLPQLKHDRISLSLAVINNARYVIFLIQGMQKADIVRKILEENLICPAAQVNPANGQLIFLLNKEAAKKLSHPMTYIPGEDVISIKKI